MKENVIIKYLQESFQELNRVSWPTKNQAVRITAIVLGFSLGIAAILAALDFFFEFGRNYLLTNIKF